MTRAIAVRVKVFLGNRYLNHSASIEYFLNTFIRVRALYGRPRPQSNEYAKSVTRSRATSHVKISKTPIFFFVLQYRPMHFFAVYAVFTVFLVFFFYYIHLFTTMCK